MASKRLFSVFFLLLVFFTATELEPLSVQAEPCYALSDKFKGPCFRSANCDGVCKTEGLLGGHCDGNFQCTCQHC